MLFVLYNIKFSFLFLESKQRESLLASIWMKIARSWNKSIFHIPTFPEAKS